MLFILPLPPLPKSTLFPYTTLFRSLAFARNWPAALSCEGSENREGAVSGGNNRLRDAALRAVQLETPCAVLRSEEHTSELQSRQYLVCRLLLEKKKKNRRK